MGDKSAIQWTDSTWSTRLTIMAQTPAGALKVAARRLGISEAEYIKRTGQGLKWCGVCRKWHDRTEFGMDASRGDGLDTGCLIGRSAKRRSLYVPKARPARGRSFVPPRTGDKRQARRRVNYFVESGLLPKPNSLPCSECGHVWRPGGRRHEYDHHRGYAAENHEVVEVVCSRCHHRRH